MLLKKITLTNIGIYKGTHIVDLETSVDKPVILFGALNGGGKTTFLDSLQLVLYGKFAKCSNRGSLSYGAFLATTRNRYAQEDEEVSIELVFSHTSETLTNTYRVKRSWTVARSVEQTKDKIEVFTDGAYDALLSQYWDDFVNEFLPLSLSDLFFFDGEKIENLAHPSRSAELIQTGIENLLGLDLFSQLQIDLGAQERLKKSDTLDATIINKVSQCENEIGEVSAELSALRKHSADLDQEASDVNIQINKQRQQARQTGAHLIEERDSIQFELGSVRQKLTFNKQQRVQLDSGCGPLALIKPLLDSVQKQAEKEQTIQKARQLDAAIHDYEASLLNSLSLVGVDMLAKQAVEDAMANLASQRQAVSSEECYIGFPPEIFNGLNDKLAADEVERAKLNEEREWLLEQESLLEKKEQAIPDYESVKHILVELNILEQKFNEIAARKQQVEQEIERAEAKYSVLNQRYTQLLTQQNKDTFEQKRALQIADHIQHLKQTMDGFARDLIRDNLTLLETKIAEKFAALTRKNKLVERITIDPSTFDLALYSEGDQRLSTSRLSAGERQLLAVAVMWGLAEASGRELPMVIDTPLGRLDGQHRSRLIDSYFPYAAPQVILLSTDEEIFGQYYQSLAPYISREYHIQYDETEQTSRFTEGYF
ncbi:DNA sulfur modification protein DndD [Marinomonas piezotolerans]|uniref:DNA sulfur modification protein DndD n=1 Tax=Marinomonas piezotolerans TaxID=2213058 RepID=A0A370UC01_9GAMM|nr:DNA sulfur modification protein DndD [Marinomonas piezotolerans]RDL45326.1 DNA sulfur modification protein DndD [Marinomonas piezotolerans]